VTSRPLINHPQLTIPEGYVPLSAMDSERYINFECHVQWVKHIISLISPVSNTTIGQKMSARPKTI
jgi:hypothetical protein